MESRSSFNHAIECAWAAGFIEGEGCFHAKKARHGRSLAFLLRVSQSDPRPLKRLADLAGHGNVTGPYRPAGVGKLPVYAWSIQGEKALHMLRLIAPYMEGPKKEQAARELSKVYGDRTPDIEGIDAV